MMYSKLTIAFVEAVREVVLAETGLELTRGELQLSNEVFTTDEVTVIISLVGTANGSVLYTLNTPAVLTLVRQMMGEPITTFDSLAQSAIAELGNVITGRAVVKLSSKGYSLNISPPMLAMGANTSLSTLDLPRLIIPFQLGQTEVCLHLHLAVRDSHTGPL